MRSEHFSGGPASSKIRGKREQPIPQSRNWDRIVYLAILGILALTGIYHAVTYYLFFYGDGYVITSSLEIRAPNDIKLVTIFPNEGDSVRQDERLFSYGLSDWQQSVDSMENVQSKRRSLQNDIEDINDDLIIKRQKLKELQDKLDYLLKRRETLEKEVKLNVETVTELNEVELNIRETRSEINILNTELSTLYSRKENIENRISALSGSNQDTDVTFIKNTYTHRSPVSGMVSSIFKEDSEIAIKSERIMTIQREQTDVYIRVTFSQESAEYLDTGDVLNVEFDNSESSEGVIRDIYVSRSTLIDRRQQGQNGMNRQIIVELNPVNDEARDKWRKYSNMGVTASTSIF